MENITQIAQIDEINAALPITVPKTTTPRGEHRSRFAKPFSILAVLLIWQAVAILNQLVAKPFYNPLLFPAPFDILKAAWGLIQTGDLQRNTISSLMRIIVGLLLATPIGILLGIGVARIRWIENIAEPIIELLRPVPTLALLPLFVLWFGIGESSKVAFIAYSCFFVIFTTTMLGVRNVDPVLLRAAQSLGLKGFKLYRFVILKSAFPDIMVGFRLGLSVGFLVIVASEFIAADTGLGYLINYSRTYFRVDQMLVGAAVIGILGLVTNYALLAVEQRIFSWRPTSER
ncbi:MAG: ABC transporter permease [Chloroflexota bacterium]